MLLADMGLLVWTFVKITVLGAVGLEQAAFHPLLALGLTSMAPPPLGMPVLPAYNHQAPVYATVKNPVTPMYFVRGRVNCRSAATGYLDLPADTFGAMICDRLGKTQADRTPGYRERDLGNAFLTIEGNTGLNSKQGIAADRMGQGIYRKRRLKSQMIFFKRWVSAHRDG